MIPSPEDIQNAVDHLIKGKVILYPTDTIWGIGCAVSFPKALDRIFEIKQRPSDKSVILLVDSISMLKQYVERIHPRIETLMGFHEKPMTVIYPKAKNLDPVFTAADGSIAIRVCKDVFCQSVIQRMNQALVSTSANRSGMNYPENFNAILPEILEEVDYVVKYRQMDKSIAKPSMIVKYDNDGELIFIRN